MFFKAYVPLALVAAFVGNAVAQSSSAAAPTSTSSIDPCILSCVESAATAGGCSSFTDISCVCSSTAFQSAALSCLEANCTSSDITAAQALQSEECAAVSASASASSATGSASSVASSASSVLASVSSAVSSVSSVASSSASSASSAASSAAAKSSSAGMKVGGQSVYGGVVGMMFALLGVVAGAGLVL